MLNSKTTRMLVCGAVMGIFLLPRAAWAQQRSFDLPAEAATQSIPEFARQAGIQIIAPGEKLRGLRTAALKGSYDVRAALAKLLQGSGLKIAGYDGSTITLAESASSPAAPKEATRGGPDVNSISSASDSTHALPVDIVVTAQKRAQRLLDVPAPVTALSASGLVNANQTTLQDYFQKVPSLSLVPSDYDGAPTLAIRGVTTGFGTNPTVGVIVDDVPYGATTSLGGGTETPDLDPSDLSRIEVLRGPQGTLYGAASIGGLLKYVTVDPSTAALSGRIETDLSGTQNGNGPSYGARLSANIPITDDIAIRASGFGRHNTGYIDDPSLGLRGVNHGQAYGGRLAALWRISSDWTLKLSGLYQKARSYGSSDVDQLPGLHGLQQERARGTGGLQRVNQNYTVTLTGVIGKVGLVSLSGYGINHTDSNYDYTPLLGQATLQQFGVAGTPLLQNIRVKKFTQEVRATVPIGSHVDWLIGSFYDSEKSAFDLDIYASNVATGAVVGQFVDDNFPTSYSEIAAFTNVTVRFTDKLEMQLGGRESRNHQRYNETFVGPFTEVFFSLPSPLVIPQIRSSDSSFTYLATLQYHFRPRLMTYIRLASGYRTGGPNAVSTVFNVPLTYKPDTTQNYEFGVKGEFLDRRLTIDTSVYHIDWKDIQLSVIDPVSGQGYTGNAAQARINGAEASVEAVPWRGMALSGYFAYTDAITTKDLPAANFVFGEAGSRLPYSSRYSGNLSATQDITLSPQVTGSAGITASYVGNRVGTFTSTEDRQQLPSYTKIDLIVGVRFHSWSGNLFANNVADKRGVLNGGLGTANPSAFAYIQPRTIGLSLIRDF